MGRCCTAVRVLLLPLFLILLMSCGKPPSPVAVKSTILKLEQYAAVAYSSAEHHNIWGEASPAGLSKIIKSAGEASDRGYQIIESTKTVTAAQNFLQNYQNSNADVLTLVGHNDNGTFKFGDKSSFLLKDLGNDDGPVVAILSCESSKFANGKSIGLPTEITFSVAYATGERFSSKIQQLPTLPNHVVLQQMLVDSLNEVMHEKNVRIAYQSLGSVGVGVVGIAVWQPTP